MAGRNVAFEDHMIGHSYDGTSSGGQNFRLLPLPSARLVPLKAPNGPLLIQDNKVVWTALFWTSRLWNSEFEQTAVLPVEKHLLHRSTDGHRCDESPGA